MTDTFTEQGIKREDTLSATRVAVYPEKDVKEKIKEILRMRPKPIHVFYSLMFMLIMTLGANFSGFTLVLSSLFGIVLGMILLVKLTLENNLSPDGVDTMSTANSTVQDT